MTHSPETGAKIDSIFPAPVSGACVMQILTGFVWYCRNRRRLEHCSISKPETGVRVTEMVIYHGLLFIFVISCKQSVNSRVVIYLFIVIRRLRSSQPRLFCARNFHSRRIWYEKPASKTGARK